MIIIRVPKIVISEEDLKDNIVLNEFFSNELSASINEIDIEKQTFSLSGIADTFNFDVRVFKFFSPKNQKSKVSLVAHNREVTDTVLHNYVPEFVDEFFDKEFVDDKMIEKNYIIKAYVFSNYLDDNVSYERGGFEFQKENDLLFGIAQNDIEREASIIAKDAIGSEITVRQEKKKTQINAYVEECAPWHRELLDDLDLQYIPYKPSDEDIEIILQKEKFKQDVKIKKEINQLLKENNIEDLKTKATEIVRKISGTSKNELVHYVALRRNVLDIFERSLELNPDGGYSSEGVVHDIIFPRKGDSNITSFENHNLWIIDERLNFTDYISSDLPLNTGKTDRPDLLAYDKRVTFRGDNEPSNPVSIFEFKKPQRDDFVNPSSKEDPIQQIVRYVNKIREGDYKTPEGREILISSNTPFFGYVVCDLTQKVKKWLEVEKDFKPMPDRLGYYQWRENINLYIEVISWDKVLKDANMRNRIFFHKLGI